MHTTSHAVNSLLVIPLKTDDFEIINNSCGADRVAAEHEDKPGDQVERLRSELRHFQ